MREKDILNSIKGSIEQAPIDQLENIKKAPRVKMLKHDEITEQGTRKNPFKRFMPYGSIAAALILVFFGWQYGTKAPDSYIYMDVNPGVEIITNRGDRVIGVEASNKDGRTLTEDFDYKGKTINQVAEEILDRMIGKKYLDKDHNFLLLSVYNKNNEKAELQKVQLNKKIHEHLEKKEVQPIVLSQELDKTSTIEKYAKEYGVSVSKMTFIRNLIILNPELETEDLVYLTIEDLVNLSQNMGLELDRIIESTDINKINMPKIEIDEEVVEEAEPEEIIPIKPKKEIKGDKPIKKIEDDDDEDDDGDDAQAQASNIISPNEAKKIALSIANGKIKDFDFDDDDLEYEIEIELGEKEYEITIDGKTGKVLEVEIDD